MARRLLIGAAAVIVIGAIVGRLAHGPFWLSGEAQVSPAEPTDGPGVDFDGDEKVAPWERITESAWAEHPTLSKVLDAALANGRALASGDVDISAYLRSIERPRSPEGALVESRSCSDTEWPCCFIRGDADRSWSINMTDVTTITNYLFLGGPIPPVWDAADADDLGDLNLTDATYIAAYLFSGGPEPPAPCPAPGTDPTYDPFELPCQDQGDFEHERNPLEESEIVLAPTEDPGLPKDMVPSDPTEPIDGTGGFGGLAPDLPVFSAPAGLAWGFRPSYRTRYALRGDEAQPFVLETEAGRGWFTGIPHVVDAGTTASARYWVRWSASCVRGYEQSSPGVYSGRFTNQTTLVEDNGANEIRLYDLSGKTYVFYGYGASAGTAKGRIKRIEGLGGMTIAQVLQKPRIEFDWDLEQTGKLLTATLITPLETTQALKTCQVWHYVHGGAQNELRIASVSLERPTLPENVRFPYEVSLRHWQSSLAEVGGTAGDLMEVDVTNDLTATSGLAPQTITRRCYYRYYTSESWNEVTSPGHRHQIQHVLGPDATKDLDPASYPTADVSALADRTYTFCEDRRARTLKVRGISCGGCGGQGSYTYGWSLEKAQKFEDPLHAAQPNESHLRVHIELPHESSVDSLRRIICFNAYGEKISDARSVRETAGSSELHWVQGAEYGATEDEKWFLRHVFWPSAKASFAPAAMLACESGATPAFDGDGSQLEGYAESLTNGKHLEYEYTPDGDTLVITSRLGQGRNGRDPMSAVSRLTLTHSPYRKRAVTERIRRYDGPASFNDVEFDYDYGPAHTEDPLALASYKMLNPAVYSNGSGVATWQLLYEDRLGMLRWLKDEAGRVEYREYDGLTGQTYGVVTDFNTGLSHPGLTPGAVPAGFASTGSDRVDAVSFYLYDALGRVVSVETPAGLADDNSQLRRSERHVYAKLVGPAGKPWADRPVTLTYPHVGAGAPMGEISIEVSTPGGRTAATASAFLPAGSEPYFFVDHWSWSSPVERLDQVFAPANRILLERTEYDYSHDTGDDHLIVTESVWTQPEAQLPADAYETVRHHDAQGRAAKVVGRLGAAGFREEQVTTYDALGRATAWATGLELQNLNVTRRVAYDGGYLGGSLVVGDGHVTRTVAYTGDGHSPDRHTRQDFDWRGLPTATWDGYDPVSQTAILIASSPSYVEDDPEEVQGYDYAGRRIREWRYADTIAAANLRAKSETLYDEVDRVYETRTYGVEESTGTVVGTPGAPPGQPIPLTTRSWYDARGNVIKRLGPGATFRKYVYDGAGRIVVDYLAYDITPSEAAYTAADDVTGDTVLEQSTRVLDKAGNPLLVTTCARYPSTPSYALGDLSGMTGIYRRREFRAFWFDTLGRNVVEAFYGDNGNADAAFTRPTQRPSATTFTVQVTKRSWPETITSEGRRWGTSTDVDGQVTGSEVDALGQVVRTWRRPASNLYFVTDLELDALGHTAVETVYQPALSSSVWPAEPPAFSLLDVPHSSTAYDWGLEEGTENFLASTGLLASVRLPNPDDPGNPVAEKVRSYFYNLQGEAYLQRQRNSGSETVEHRVIRDARGHTVREVVDGSPHGPTALEWDRDAVGRLAAARSLDANEAVLNEVQYGYDAWGALSELRESHEGPVTTLTPRVSHEFQGPTMAASGQNVYPIVHRPTYQRISKAGPVEYAASYHDYGLAGSMSHILGRPAFEVAALVSTEESPWTTWAEAYKIEESYLGSRRWVKTVESEKHAGQWGTQLTQEIPSLETVPSGGLSRFGYPRKFKASKGSDVPLERSYTYSSSTGRLWNFIDQKTNPTLVTVAVETFTFDGFGRLSTFHHNANESVEGQEGYDRFLSWGFDGAGNWTCFSGDGGSCGGGATSRVYDRRNQILQIQGDPNAVDYDDAGRIVTHNFAAHHVDATFWYDAWNRLAGYHHTPSQQDFTFEYDALGHLLSCNIEGETYKRYYHDASGRVLWRCGANGEPFATHVRSSGSGRIFSLLGSAPYSYVVDPNGTPVCLTDSGVLFARLWTDGTGDYFSSMEDVASDAADRVYDENIEAAWYGGGRWISTRLGETTTPAEPPNATAPTDSDTAVPKKLKMRYAQSIQHFWGWFGLWKILGYVEGDRQPYTGYQSLVNDARTSGYSVDSQVTWRGTTTNESLVEFGTAGAAVFVYFGHGLFSESAGRVTIGGYSEDPGLTLGELRSFNARLALICACSGGWVFNGVGKAGPDIVCGPKHTPKPKTKVQAGYSVDAVGLACRAFLSTLRHGGTVDDARVHAESVWVPLQEKADTDPKQKNPGRGLRRYRWDCKYSEEGGLSHSSTLEDIYDAAAK